MPWNTGKPWSQKTRAKISASKRGAPPWNKGRQWPAEVVEKIRAAKKRRISWNKGKPWPNSVKAKIRRAKLAALLGTPPLYERGGLSPRLRFEIFKRDGFRCQYCGRTSVETILELDHIMPVSRGGSNAHENLRTACVDCNRGKAAETL